MALQLTGMTKANAMVDAAVVPSILIALLPAPLATAPLVTLVMPKVAKVDHITPLLIDRDVPAPSCTTAVG